MFTKTGIPHLAGGYSRKPLTGFNSPRQIYNARRGGRLVPLAKSITPAAAGVFPPRQIHNARAAGVFPPRHLWRGGDRQAGGEVYIHKKGHSKRAPKSPYIYQRLIAIRETICISLIRFIRISCSTRTNSFIVTIRYICHVTKFTILAI